MNAENNQTALGPAPKRSELLSLAETLSSLIALIQDDRLVYVNPAGCALLGHPSESLVGRHFREVVHPDDRDVAIARAKARLDGHAPKRVTERLIHADGHTIWMEYSIDVIQFEGRPTTLVTGNDVTDRLRMEEDLRRGEARLAEAQRISHIGSWEWDIAASRITWSDELCRIYGVEPKDFGGTVDGYLALVHPEDRATSRANLERALRDGGTFAFEHRVVHRDGAVRTIFGSGEVFTDESGNAVRMAGTGQDITERRRMEEELRRSEERFRGLCTQAPVMMMSFDPSGCIRDVSNCWLETTGYERHEVVGQEGWTFITPDSRERMQKAIAESQKNKLTVIRNLPVQGIRKDGTTIELLSTSVAEFDDSGAKKGAICVQINLTDLQRAEEALRESEERYRALVEHAPEAITVLDVETGRFIDANARAARLFGCSREELLTMGPLDVCEEQQANGRASCEVFEEEYHRVIAGETVEFEFARVDESGRAIVCHTRLSQLPAAGRKLIRATMTDVTELKELQEKVRRAEKLAAVGVLAAGVAHEIGNPLMALSMAAESLERRACDEYASRKLALIREHIDRISRIVRQMSDLARPQSGPKASHDVNRIVRRAVEMARHDERSRDSEIRYELAEELPPVEAVEDELTQVCINLALNAFDAMAGNPGERPRRLTIRSEAPDDLVRVSFLDTGPGVPPEVRSKLFQPFFTTKEAGRGSGLGLSVSYRILEEHGGTLRIEDEASTGAAFVIELPVSRDAKGAKIAKRAPVSS